MRVGGRDLLIWSFLMASAHGAGLMLMPILLAHPAMDMGHTMSGMMPADIPLGLGLVLFAVLVHTLAMLIVGGTLATAFFEFYESVGLKLLRHAWVNFDLLWALALLGAGISVLFF